MSLFLFATLNFMEGFPVPKGKDFQQVDIVCSHHEHSFADLPKALSKKDKDTFAIQNPKLAPILFFWQRWTLDNPQNAGNSSHEE